MKPTISIFDFERAVMYSDLPSSVRLTLFVLRTFASKHGESIFPSYQTIADRTGLSRITVIRSIKEAEEGGWILKEKRTIEGMSTTNNYTLLIPPKKERGDTTEYHSDTTVVSPRHHGSITVIPKHTIEQTNEQTLSKGKSDFSDPVDLLQSHCSSTIPLIFADMIRKTVTDYERWAAVIWQAQESKWNLSNVRALLDVYQKHEQPNGKNTRKNGNTARNVDFDELAESGRRSLAMLQQLGLD